jgi:hypothetical protein
VGAVEEGIKTDAVCGQEPIDFLLNRHEIGFAVVTPADSGLIRKPYEHKTRPPGPVHGVGRVRNQDHLIGLADIVTIFDDHPVTIQKENAIGNDRLAGNDRSA